MSTGNEYWERKYSGDDFVYGRAPNLFLVEHAFDFIRPGGRALSLGEGEGRNAVWMAKQGWEVTAVDYSRAAIGKLERYAREAGVEIEAHCLDVLDFECGRQIWDALVLLHLHLPPKSRRELHRRAYEALRPGGVLILEALRPEQLQRSSSGPDREELLYSVDDLREDFEGMEILLMEEEDRLIEAGEHRGITSVVSLIASRPIRKG